MTIEEKIMEMGQKIPEYHQPDVPLIPANCAGGLIFSSGNTATKDGKLFCQGIVGENITLEQAKEAAQICTLNCLSSMRHTLKGDLERIKKIIKVNGYVACTPDFRQQADVINMVSFMILDAFGQKGQLARSALGVSSLPGGSPVEVEIIAEYE